MNVLTEEIVELTLANMLRVVRDEEHQGENELVELSEHFTSVTIDTVIRETATETLTEYTIHVETAKAIEDRLSELADEMVESE